MAPLLFFAVTLFVSAFLLFLVQPIIGKMILPKLGGTPQVWNTCMVFFQSALLAGYAYTHTVSTRLQLKTQLIVHGILLFLPFLVLLPNGPFNVIDWSPSRLGGNPIPDTLLLLSLIVGLPFLVVATSAPLLQKWFAHTGHPAAEDPYFLYAASNLGSMAALIAYPAIVEPIFGLRDQAWIFTGGYVGFLALVLGCAALVWVTGKEMPQSPVPDGPALDVAPAAAPTSSSATAEAIRKGPAPKSPARPVEATQTRGRDELTVWRRLRWIGLAAVPSSFMLGVTTHITTDLSPIPLFWLVPLTLYLLSFILVYMRWPVLWADQPHKIVLVAQPIAIALMIFFEVLNIATTQIWVAVFFDTLAFFLTALACHGELAKDRPSTRHLTEYFLLMSVGGMLGGVFNGLMAPVLFIHVIEFNIAVILACFLRPTLKEEGWTDAMMMGMLENQPAHAGQKHAKGAKPQSIQANAEAPTSYATLMDFALPIALAIFMALLVFVVGRMVFPGGRGGSVAQMIFVYGLPLMIACFFYARPLRFGLAIAAIIGIHSLHVARGDSSIFADRSYFGVIRVKEDSEPINGVPHAFRQLIHGHINHGMNFRLPTKKDDLGNPAKDFSRLPTTYYHRYGPAGVVMEKFNWFPGPQNTYWADARMPASLVGLGVDAIGMNTFGLAPIVGLWSEPPFATIGLGTGTMAAYGRAFQHVHFYEIDNHVRRLSLPDDDSEPFFNFLQQAKKRQAIVQVLMGDARLRMHLPYKNHYAEGGTERGGGPQNFYHMMVVDAFSSDAIPVHLITKEGIKMYFDHLTEEGILCVHTSNRFVDLPKVVAAVASNLGYAYMRGHDLGNEDKKKVDTGRYSSEWVMVARKPEYLAKLKTPPNSTENENRNEDYWSSPPAYPRYLWTDDHSNLLSVLKR